MHEPPKGQYRRTVDQVHKAFIREGDDPREQLGENRLVTEGRTGAFAQQRRALLGQKGFEGFQLGAGWGALCFSGAAPRHDIALHIAVPVNVVAQLITLRDGQMQGHGGIFAANRFA